MTARLRPNLLIFAAFALCTILLVVGIPRVWHDLDGTERLQGYIVPDVGVGAQGVTGVSGPSGSSGPSGVSGATGPTGERGVTGPSGAQGATGASGLQGVTGASGPPGPLNITEVP